MGLANGASGAECRNGIKAGGIGVLSLVVVLGTLSALGALTGCLSPSGTESGRPGDPDPEHTWTRSSSGHKI